MLIAYSVSTVATYSGVIEVTPEEYEELIQMDSIEKGIHIMETINWGNEDAPEFRYVESLDHFAPL